MSGLPTRLSRTKIHHVQNEVLYSHTRFRQSNVHKRDDKNITVHTKFWLHSPTQGVKTKHTILTEEAASSSFIPQLLYSFVLFKSRMIISIFPQLALFCWLECVCTLCPCSVYNSFPSTRSRIFIVESLDAVIRKWPAGWKHKLFTTPLWTGNHTHTLWQEWISSVTQEHLRIKEQIIGLQSCCIYTLTSCVWQNIHTDKSTRISSFSSFSDINYRYDVELESEIDHRHQCLVKVTKQKFTGSKPF